MAKNTDNKQIYQEKAKAQLDKLNAQIDELKAKSKQVKADAQIEYQDKIAQLSAKRDVAQVKLQELQESSEEAWTEMQQGFEKAWTELNTAWKSALNKFQ